MNPNREEALFRAAAQLRGAERSAFLGAVCASTPAVRRRLEALLAGKEENQRTVPLNAGVAGLQIEEGSTELTPTLLDETPVTEGPGTVIGRYRLLEKIGEGGFGAVYAAEQKEPVKRRVALKIIKLGMDTRQVVARFESERQALALMDHPNIAKVLDAGTTDTGRPYFVMELVRGIPITQHCDQNNLPAEKRLKLFIQVCQAIQHAHQKGIIHRDIKPPKKKPYLRWNWNWLLHCAARTYAKHHVRRSANQKILGPKRSETSHWSVERQLWARTSPLRKTRQENETLPQAGRGFAGRHAVAGRPASGRLRPVEIQLFWLPCGGAVSPSGSPGAAAGSVSRSKINMHTTILIDEKKHAEQAAQESEQRYKRLLAAVTDYVYSVAVEQGRPARTSHGLGCEAVTGYTPREFEADLFLWYRMIYHEDRPAVTAQAEQVLRGETPPPLEHRIVHKDGRIRWIRNTPVPHKDDRGRLIYYDGLISDITERKRAEQFLAVEHAVTRELAEASSLDETLTRILESICATLSCFQWDMAAFWGVDAKANLLRCGEIWCSPSTQAKEFAAVSRRLPLAPGISVPGQVWASGEPAWIPDLLKAETKCPRAPYARTADLHGTCGFPVRSGKQCLGVIELFSRQIQPPDPDMMQTLMVLGAQIGQFIERKAVEEQHRLSQAQLQAILDNSPALIHLKDAQGRYILVNRRFQQILHLSREEIIGKSPRDLFPQETANALLNHDQKVLATLTPMEFEETVPGDGEPHLYLSVKFPFLDAAGVPCALCGISTDITERKRAEAVLQRSTEEIRDLYNNAPCGYHSLDKDGVFLRINDTELKWLGYSREEVIGRMRFSELVMPEGLEVFHKNFPLLKQRGWVSNLEFELVRKDGTTLAVLLSATAIKDASGNYVMNRATMFDITERKRADLELQRSYQTQEVLNALLSISLQDLSLEETSRQVIDQVLAIPWLSVEAKGAIFVVEADPSALVLKAQRNLPASLEAACGLVPFGRCHCGRAAASGKIEFAAHLDDHHEIRYEGMTPHGHYCVPIVSADQVLGVMNLYVKENHRQESKEDEFLNAVANVLGGIIQRKQAAEQLKQAMMHLTTVHEELKATHEELKATELQLIQAAKLEAVGTLAAGVAHEVKNPLQTILMGLDYLANNLSGANDNTTLVLSDMRDAVTRANVIVRELLQLSAARDFEPKEEDLNGLVERSLWLINNQVMALRINVVRRLGTNLPRVLLDRSKMEQVFLNLFINALQAMSQAGVLTVTTRHRRFGEDLELSGPAFAQFEPGELVVIAEVQDNGKGIPEDHLPKIFDPFFTTKPAGVGTGLGLSVVKKIMDLHGGAIDVRNAPLGGVVVTLMLRAAQEQNV